MQNALQNSNCKYFFNLTLKKFENVAQLKPRMNDDENILYRMSILYFGNLSHKFGCNLTKLIRRKFDFDRNVYYKTIDCIVF